MNGRQGGAACVWLALAMLLVLARTTAAAESRRSSWVRVRDRDGLFSAAFPGPPEFREEAADSSPRGRPERRYSYEGRGESYLAQVTEIPSLAAWLAPEGLLYDRAKEGYLDANEATEVSFAEIRRSGTTGRALEFTAAPAGATRVEGRAEFFLRDRHILVFEAVVPQGAARGNLDAFFDGIRLFEEKP